MQKFGHTKSILSSMANFTTNKPDDFVMSGIIQLNSL